MQGWVCIHHLTVSLVVGVLSHFKWEEPRPSVCIYWFSSPVAWWKRGEHKQWGNFFSKRFFLFTIFLKRQCQCPVSQIWFLVSPVSPLCIWYVCVQPLLWCCGLLSWKNTTVCQSMVAVGGLLHCVKPSEKCSPLSQWEWCQGEALLSFFHDPLLLSSPLAMM